MILEYKKAYMIVEVFCAYYKMTPQKLFELNREGWLVKRRQMCLTQIKKLTKLTSKHTGNVATKYGRKKPIDHATVLHAIKCHNIFMDTDYSYNKDYHRILSLIPFLHDTDNLQNKELQENINLFEAKEYYENLIIEMKEAHAKELSSFNKVNAHPIFEELQVITPIQLDRFYQDRWKPFKKINKL